MKILRGKFSRRFLSDSFWSFSGNTLSVVAGLALVKITTSLVDANDYGKASLVLGIIVLLNNLIAGPLMAAHMRVYFDYMEQGFSGWFKRTFNAVLGIAGIAGIAIYLLIAFAYEKAGQKIFFSLALPAAILILAQPFMGAATNYLEAHRSYKKLAVANVLQKALQPAMLVLLLAASFSGSSAIIFAQGLAIIPLVFVFGHARTVDEKKLSPGLNGLWALKLQFSSFGLSLPLGYLAHWALSTGDRYLIEHYLGVESVGGYAMNYGFWSIPYFLLNGWLEILSRPRLYEDAAKGNWVLVKKTLMLRAAFGCAVAGAGTVVIYFAGGHISSLMLGTEYSLGKPLMMGIAAAHFFCVLGYSAMPIFLAGKKTKVILWATLAAAVINIAINLYAIPVYGVAGAAMSTLAAYFLWSMILGFSALALLRRLTKGG